jgi:hypothetical protein
MCAVFGADGMVYMEHRRENTGLEFARNFVVRCKSCALSSCGLL